VRFWDSSALFPVVVPERGTARVRQLIAEDPEIVVWALTRVELLSAVARRRRELQHPAAWLVRARRELLDASTIWAEVSAVDLVRTHAERIVERYPLRAADAVHIGAALVASDGDPTSLDFVTLDEAQARAAEGEGFRVLGM
jgi:predicted nucleic acid-binding protein